MTKQTINVGTSANDRKGDSLRTAFQKVNANFTELYSSSGFTGTTDRLVNNTSEVVLSSSGILTLPYSNYLETIDINLQIGSQGVVTIRSDAASNLTTKSWTFDTDGSLTVPSPVSPTITLTFDAAHYVATDPKPTLTLTGAPWELMGEYVYAPDGQSMLALNNIWPTLDNPGYDSGDQFTFDESVHGRAGYTLTITLNDVVQAGPAGWTANVAASPAPAYTPTIQSNGAIKLVADEASWSFGTDGTLTVPGPIFRDGGLYMNSSGSTTAASVFVSGNSGGVILRTADNAQQVSHDLIFDVTGGLTLPSAGFVRQRHSFTRTTVESAPAATATVIWSASQDWISSIKLTIQVEGNVTGDATGWHVQTCEATIASRGYADGTYGYGDPEMTVYGVIHTSVSPLATFEVQRNPTTRLVEVVATGTDISNNIIVSIHSVEIGTTD
jgi:hypothetical protein